MIDSAAKRIRGKIDPFRSVLDPVIKNTNTVNGVELFREHIKDAVALRMRYTLYTPLDFSDSCYSIIRQYIADPYISSMIICSLKYYCDQKKHIISRLDYSSTTCTSKDFHKSLQHAKQDCLVCVSVYTKKIKKMGESIGNNKIVQKCIDIESGTAFFVVLFMLCTKGNCPKQLNRKLLKR